jgi:molecular chaperone GrpE
MADTKPTSDGAAPEAVPEPSELERLRVQLRDAEQKRDDNLQLAQRMRADLENYQKRTQRDLAVERRYAQMPLAADLLGPLDNLERATAVAQQAGDKGALAQGVTMVVAQVLDVLRRHGVTRIDALGKELDPNVHQAVMQQPTTEYPPGTVSQVLESGYLFHDRVLRPARVAVAVEPAPAGTSKG